MPPPLPGMGGMRGPPPLPGMGGMRGPPPMPGMPGARGPPPMPGGLGMPRPMAKIKKPSKTPPHLEPKPKIKPSKKMKGFFWSELIFKTESDYKSSMWSSIDDKNPEVDFKDFENAFGKVEKAKVTKGKSKTSSKPKKNTPRAPPLRFGENVCICIHALPIQYSNFCESELNLTAPNGISLGGKLIVLLSYSYLGETSVTVRTTCSCPCLKTISKICCITCAINSNLRHFCMIIR